MSTFNLYRFSPHHLRKAIHARLAWSLKQLLDAWPDAEIAPSVVAAEGFFLRLQRGHVDGCDFLLHHRLVTHLLADEFEQARGILEVGAARQPRLRSTVLCYGSTELGDDARWYAQALSLNDLPSGSLLLTAPQPDAAERSRGWLEQLEPLLRVGSPQAYAELVAFRPLWLLASVGATSQIGFGGYSSCLAWGTIALNANRGSGPELLIQAIHELAHQLLFALALDVPLVFNDPSALYASPLRPDQRPMDGVMHACFVSARVLEVLAQIQASPAWGGLSATDQARLVEEQQQSRQSVRDSLPTIEAFAQLSALGERVVQAARGVVEG